jgi:hypothetical protein
MVRKVSASFSPHKAGEWSRKKKKLSKMPIIFNTAEFLGKSP